MNLADRIRKLAEQLDARWFRVREKKRTFNYMYCKRIDAERVALFDGRHASHIVSKAKAAEAVTAVRDAKRNLAYLPDAEQTEIERKWDWALNA